MQRIRRILGRWTATRYTRLLEAEVARLRAENRALLNSILGIAGIPPIPVVTPELRSGEGQRSTSIEANSGLDRAGAARLVAATERAASSRNASSPIAGPLRRRSWHQINRALEIDSARKKEREIGEAPALGVAVKAP